MNDGSIGMIGYLIATVGGAYAGAWVYWRVRGDDPEPSKHERSACVASGMVATIVGTALYYLLGVQVWLVGPDGSWYWSALLGLVLGILQALRFRGKLLRRRPRARV
jgi:MFS family permease